MASARSLRPKSLRPKSLKNSRKLIALNLKEELGRAVVHAGKSTSARNFCIISLLGRGHDACRKGQGFRRRQEYMRPQQTASISNLGPGQSSPVGVIANTPESRQWSMTSSSGPLHRPVFVKTCGWGIVLQNCRRQAAGQVLPGRDARTPRPARSEVMPRPGLCIRQATRSEKRKKEQDTIRRPAPLLRLPS